MWGYEYYGGARTVDVHIRRLRAKLGEEHANLIQTVRSRRLPLRPVPLGRVISTAEPVIRDATPTTSTTSRR